jgi:hypothetical protein
MYPMALPSTPFTVVGTSHNKLYERKSFSAKHFFQIGGTTEKNVIQIVYDSDDLLPLMSISLLRAGELIIRDDELHINTFNKLNNEFYRNLLSNILNSFNELSGYDDIKADSWPMVYTIDDFYNLPQWIIDECKTVYNFAPIKIDKFNPNIKRSTLREAFKIGFKNPNTNGFMKEIEKMSYVDCNLYQIPFNSFYNYEEFNNQLKNIEEFFNLTFIGFDLKSLHADFLKRQPYKNLKKETDQLIDEINNGGSNNLIDLTLFQESYIDAELELQYNIEMPTRVDVYFPTTKHIFKYINEI